MVESEEEFPKLSVVSSIENISFLEKIYSLTVRPSLWSMLYERISKMPFGLIVDLVLLVVKIITMIIEIILTR
jgi:hypothetical protein